MMQRGWSVSLRVLPSVILTLSFLILFSTCGQESAKWYGTVEEVGGVIVVENPKEPMYGADIIKIEEELTIGEAGGREEYLFENLWFIVVDDRERIFISEGAGNRAHIHTFGWPIGAVPPHDRRDEFGPFPTSDGIMAELDFKDTENYDYWTIRKDGSFFLLKALFEEKRDPSKLFFDTRIIRITEVLLYAIRLYSGLNVISNTNLTLRIRHGGLIGRELSVAGTRVLWEGRKSKMDEITYEITASIANIEARLVDYVEEFVRPLFVVFDFAEIERGPIEEIVNNYIKGKAT